ncbi:MAG: histidine kinase dimerization/phospho-acceptor domain-containing protein [Vicinamibacterales bacterium]
MKADVRGQTGWLIAIRAMISTLLLGGATLAQITAPDSFAIHPFFLLIAATYGLTILWAATLRYVDRHHWLVDAQLGCDAVTVSAFIFLTGGVTSFFASLYALPIIAGSVIGFRRGGLMVATLSAVLYLGIVGSQYLPPVLAPSHWMVAQAFALPSRAAAQYIVALNVFGFFAVALLSGSMAESVRTAGVRLQLASSELADLQALNQNVIDSLPSGLVTTDPQQRVLTFNHAAERICGVSEEAAVGRQVASVLQLPDEITHALSRGLTRAGARRLEFRFRRDDGREIDIGLSATLVDTPNGAAGFLITFQDLTDIKKLERDVRMQQRLAAVGEMAAGIAHEIRNPLASMSGSIQILREELPLSEEQEQLMDIVLRESERLNNTIRSFLDYARPRRFAISRFDLRRVDPRRGAAAPEQSRCSRGARGRRRAARRTDLVRGRRRADQADRLEPGDERIAGDARRRPPRARRVDGRERGRRHRARSRDRHPARGARRALPAVPRIVREGERARARDRPSHRDRLPG